MHNSVFLLQFITLTEFCHWRYSSVLENSMPTPAPKAPTVVSAIPVLNPGVICFLLLELPFPNSDGSEATCSAGAAGLIPGSEDPLEEGTATHSSILAWRTPWTEEPGGLQSVGSDMPEGT